MLTKEGEDMRIKMQKQNFEIDGRKNNIKGITLIALVITIIILLLLTGISIGMLTGENGLLTKATESKNQTEQENAKEKIQISMMSSYDKEGFWHVAIFKEEIKKEGGSIIAEEEEKIIVEMDGYYANIDIEKGKIVDFYKVGEKQPQISLKAIYIGTRGFTVEVDVQKEEIHKFVYYVDGDKKEESVQNTFQIGGLEPSSTHKVKATVENEKGETKEIEDITITTEPITYLYQNGNEFEEVTGGLENYIKSHNEYYQNSGIIEFDGNGNYTTGTITKNENNIYITAQHGGMHAYGGTAVGVVTKKLIDFSQYKKLYIEADFYTNDNNSSHIRLLDEQEKVIKAYGETRRVPGEIGLEEFNDMAYIVIGMHSTATQGTSGNMTIKSVRLEK